MQHYRWMLYITWDLLWLHTNIFSFVPIVTEMSGVLSVHWSSLVSAQITHLRARKETDNTLDKMKFKSYLLKQVSLNLEKKDKGVNSDKQEGGLKASYEDIIFACHFLLCFGLKRGRFIAWVAFGWMHPWEQGLHLKMFMFWFDLKPQRSSIVLTLLKINKTLFEVTCSICARAKILCSQMTTHLLPLYSCTVPKSALLS